MLNIYNNSSLISSQKSHQNSTTILKFWHTKHLSSSSAKKAHEIEKNLIKI